MKKSRAVVTLLLTVVLTGQQQAGEQTDWVLQIRSIWVWIWQAV